MQTTTPQPWKERHTKSCQPQVKNVSQMPWAAQLEGKAQIDDYVTVLFKIKSHAFKFSLYLLC